MAGNGFYGSAAAHDAASAGRLCPFGKGRAYYAAFRNDNDFADDFCEMLIEHNAIVPDAQILHGDDVFLRKRADNIFVMNFSDEEREVTLDKEYKNVITNETANGKITLPVCGYTVLR